MSFLTIDVKCESCNQTSIATVDREKRNEPVDCPACGAPGAKRIFATVNNFRKAYHDGIRRPGFAELKEAALLEAKSYEMPPSERKEINKEISKLKSTKK